MLAIDLSGKRFGRVVALRRGEDIIEGSLAKVISYDCLCDCGRTFNIAARFLTRKTKNRACEECAPRTRKKKRLTCSSDNFSDCLQ